MRLQVERDEIHIIKQAWLGKLPYYFLMPTPERDGQEGWIFTPPMSEELASLPGAGMTEKDTGIRWLPEQSWDDARLKMGQLQRIYGLKPGTTAGQSPSTSPAGRCADPPGPGSWRRRCPSRLASTTSW